MRARPACGSIPAISAAASGWPKWSARPRPMAARSASASMPAASKRDLLEKYGEPCPEALVESALDHIKLLQDHDFHEFKVAVKASDVFLAVAAYMQLADAVDCPLHLGITEAGGLIGGTVKIAIGIGNLLWAGIGDTIRVSLSAEPEEEVRVGFEILKSLGLRTRGVRVVSCPSCARQGFDVIRTVQALEERLQPHQDPAVALGARLRGQRPGRSARNRYRHHRRRRGQAHGLSVGRDRPPCPGRTTCSNISSRWSRPRPPRSRAR